MNPIRVTVWNEYVHEVSEPHIAAIYPDGIHGCIAAFLREAGYDVKTATLKEPEHGLTKEVLDNTDVLLWWGHMAHGDVEDTIVKRVYDRVMAGMGLIVLHSGHASKIMEKLMGTNSGELKWRENGDKEILWAVAPNHPIMRGLPEKVIIEHEEMYGEYFNVPDPDELVLVSWFEGGFVFRSGMCYKRGLGKIFYFRPGHESFPTYHQKEVQQIITNAVAWAAPQGLPQIASGHTPDDVA